MATNAQAAANGAPSIENGVTVNRKKQKRREKAAAKLAALQPQQVTSTARSGKPHLPNGHTPSKALPALNQTRPQQYHDAGPDYARDDEDLFFSEDEPD